jgi:hypothetical protein
MKPRTLIMLAAIILFLAAPPAVPLARGHGNRASFRILDVCHKPIPAMTSSNDIPCITACACRVHPLMLNNRHAIEPFIVMPFFIPFQDELPPKF